MRGYGGLAGGVAGFARRGIEDPVFVALRDTQQRFGISDELLEELVEGTTMDLRLGGCRPGDDADVCDV